LEKAVRLRPIAILLLSASAPAQQSFEVASIKPSGPKSMRGSEGGPGSRDPARYRFQVATLLDFITIGYHVRRYQVSSRLPLDKESFDLEAKLPEGATKVQFEEMIRNLLAERFHMKVHMETQDFPAYALSVGQAGPRFSVAGGGEFPRVPAGRPGLAANYSNSGPYVLVRMRAQRQPMFRLAESLEMPAGKPVVDQTGLDGEYDFTLAFAAEPPGMGASDTTEPMPAPDIFKALRQIGLQLTPKKLPFKVVVVDAVDKAPAEN